jgi:hypothetical protein
MLAVNQSLAELGRFPSLARDRAKVTVAEYTALVLMGLFAAACSALVEFKLRIPGHAIIRVIFPMALGLALVPRRGAGLVMGTAAVAGAYGMHLMALRSLGSGALTSLILTGILLDAAVRYARRPWQVYAGVVVAAVASNLCAMAVHAVEKVGWLGAAHGGSLATWLPRAAVTYPLCGLIAGLVTAVALFRTRSRRVHE